MIEFNDSNADFSRNGISVFVDRIDVNEEIFISSSCVFLSDIITTESIHAQYNLTVLGFLCAECDVEIGGDLQCERLKGNIANIEGLLTVKEDATCDSLFVAGDAIVGSAYCGNIEIHGNLVSSGMIDATKNIEIEKSLVALDFVQSSGSITAAEVIAPGFSSAEENVGKKMTLSDDPVDVSNDPVTSSISDSDPSEIFNARSSVAIEMDGCAIFLDKLNTKLCQLAITDENLHSLLTAFRDFFPSYAILQEKIERVTPILSRTEVDADTWFNDFNTCVETLSNLPSWFSESIVSQALREKILDLLAYQSAHELVMKSFSTWIVTNYNADALQKIYADDYSVCLQLKHLHESLLSNIGLKAPFLELLFTQD